MAECYCHLSPTMRLAGFDMQDYIELHREEVVNVSLTQLCVTCKNGDTHYFMSGSYYEQWCRGRTYILKDTLDRYDKRYHSGLPLKGK